MDDFKSNSTLEEIKKTLGEFEYGLYGIFEQDTKITINPITRQVLLSDIYRHDKNPHKGICSELNVSAYNQLKNKYPDMYFYRAEGYEPNFFPRHPASHEFLLACHDTPNADRIRNLDIEGIDERNLLIIDPSFGVVKKYDQSGYRISLLHNEGVPVDYSNSKLMNHGQGTPIAKIGNSLLDLFIRFDLEHVLTFGISMPDGNGARLFDDGIYGNTVDKILSILCKQNKEDAMKADAIISKIRSIKPEYAVDPLVDLSKRITIS